MNMCIPKLSSLDPKCIYIQPHKTRLYLHFAANKENGENKL